MAQEKTLQNVLEVALRKAARQMRVHLPGKVVAVNTSGGQVRSVDVQPLLKTTRADEDNEEIVERLPVINSVPVVQPGGGGFRVTFPVAVGDTVLLAFCDSSLDSWLATGGEVLPTLDHSHHISDAVAILGLNDYAHALASAPTDRMTLGADGGFQVHVTQTDVQLGGADATDTAATKGDLALLYTAIAAVAANPAASPVPIAAVPAALKTLLDAIPGGWPPTHSSVKVKP